MAGLVVYPRGVGLLDEIGDGCENLVAPPDVPIAIGAFAGNGEPRVLVALPLPTGGWLTSEIALSLFLMAADAACNAHGDPRARDHCMRCGAHLKEGHP